MDPRVSFIVPGYNYGRFIAQAVASLLDQTFRELEVLVIDDASTDDTPGALARFADEPKVRLIRHEENQGHIRTYNEGLSLARGSYVGIMSADDFCLSRDAVARAVELFERSGRVGMVYAAYAVVEDGETVTRVSPRPVSGIRDGLDEFRSLMWGNYVLHSGTLLRRDVQIELGPYDAELPQSGDWDMWLRAAARYDIGYIAEPMYAYRMHRSNMQAKGIPPWRQADQNLRTLERGFAALPAIIPHDIRKARRAALRHAMFHTVWFDLFNGRSARAWQGVAYAVRRRPSLLRSAELWRIVPRLLLLTAAGRSRYQLAVARWEQVRHDRTVTAL